MFISYLLELGIGFYNFSTFTEKSVFETRLIPQMLFPGKTGKIYVLTAEIVVFWSVEFLPFPSPILISFFHYVKWLVVNIMHEYEQEIMQFELVLLPNVLQSDHGIAGARN
jgi:hypothetical protein